MKKTIYFLIYLVALANLTYAATIKGIILDNTGETAIGAVVTIESTSYGAVTGLDGSFTIAGVPKGNYKLKVNLIASEPLVQDIQVKDENEVITLNLSLKEQTKVLKEATIVGHVTGNSDANARLLEKNSDNVVNMLSARTLQMMPDVTVANVLRRVSGVTVDRGDNGEGRYPVIRGMDKRYNYTLINGIKIPSPDDKNRYVPMDIFPSEMLQRLEVIKSLTPEMEGDAIGGVMNLVMKDAPDRLTLDGQAALGYSNFMASQSFIGYDQGAVNMKSPDELHGQQYIAAPTDFTKANIDFKSKNVLPDGNFGFTAGNRFLNDKLGVIVSANYQTTDRITKDLFFEPNAQPNPIGYPGNQPSFTDLQLRTYYTHDQRLGTHAKLDYKINDKNSISLYTVFMQLNSYQTRYTIDSSYTDRSVPGTGDVDLLYRSKTTLQSIYNATVQGKHNIGRLFIDWSGVYSIAKKETPDMAEVTSTQIITKDSTGKYIVPTPEYSKMTRIWQHNTDQDLAGYLNIHYKTIINGQKLDFGAGGMYRHKQRDNYYMEYDLGVTNQPNATTIYNSDFAFKAPYSPTAYTDNQNIYTTTEDVAAGYADAKWQPTEKWEILAGVRNELTNLSYDVTRVPVTFPGKTGQSVYSDVLPSLNVKYKLSKNEALHFAYFKSISRPNYFELVPYQIVGDYLTEFGNPLLLHTKADNVDVRYELFPGKGEQLLVGAFYKHLNDPIELAISRPVTSNTGFQPQNAGQATNIGGEIVYTKYFHKFGVSLNYTYTYSDLTTQSKLYYKVPVAGSKDSTTTSSIVTINRPLQGQAAHVGNISLLFKDPKSGIELQVSTVYTGRHITYVTGYAGVDYWQRGNLILDFSGEKKLGKHFSVYAKVNNTLNTADIIEVPYSSNFLNTQAAFPIQSRSDRILVEKKTFGQTYLMGVRFHL